MSLPCQVILEDTPSAEVSGPVLHGDQESIIARIVWRMAGAHGTIPPGDVVVTIDARTGERTVGVLTGAVAPIVAAADVSIPGDDPVNCRPSGSVPRIRFAALMARYRISNSGLATIEMH